MNTVRQSCRPKHQVLILKCYPKFQKGVQQVKPNSSELSYLLYYASTRRSKLQKLGVFLEKRAARDVWRGKIGNVQVTLQILTALIEKLPRDLPLYGQSILTIIETVIRSNDISMVEETIPTFETFCSHQDVSAISADHEYASQYRDIVRSYAAFASSSADAPKTPLTPPEVIRWRNVGLQAIKSVVSSEALGTDGGKQLNIVVPVILQNLYLGGHDVLTPLQEKAQSSEQQEREQQARRRRMSVATVQTVDTVDGDPNSVARTTADADKAAEVEARVLALRCLERIFVTGSNRSQIRLATALILRFIASKNPPRDHKSTSSNWATSLMEATATWTPVQDRFVILVTAVETLVSNPANEEKLEQQLTLAAMIDSLLSSPINMIGLSVMDVLIGLVQHILLLLKLGGQDSQISPHHQQSVEHQDGQEPAEASLPETTEDVPSSDREITTPSPARQELVILLEKCIGDLATHIYYADQVSDMISAIMLRLKPSAVAQVSASGSENLSVAEKSIANPATLQEDHRTNNPFFSFATARIVALKAVKNILIVANSRQAMKTSGAESRSRVAIRVWEGTHWLLRDKNREVQRAYTDALLSWLRLETSKEDLKVTGEAKKLARKTSKRGASGHTETSARRAVSATSQREKLSTPRSTFLPLLHLAIYENAIEFAANESDILLLHLLLTDLADKLGVNSIRHSLPVLMRLQEDVGSSDTITAPIARRNVSSLIHGYLWGLSRRFNFETSKIGNNIENEISKRKKLGCWLENIQLPALPLDNIRSTEAQYDPEIQFDRRAIAPFTAISGLVDQIEVAYNAAAATSPVSSAPSSPGRVFSLPVLGQGNNAMGSPKPQVDDQLPVNAKEEMLSNWTKDICLATVERENAKTSSLTGSKTGTSGPRNYLAVNGNGIDNGSPTGGSPTAPHRRNQLQDRPPSTAYGLVGGIGGHQKLQHGDDSHTPLTSSSRESTVRVNELRRVLSATNDNNVRHSSPLRGRMDFARRGSRSSGTSSRESMMSGAFSASDIDTSNADPALSRPQSLRDGNGRVTQGQRDSSATPKASPAKVNNGDGENSNESMKKVESNDIPPVPPLPAALSIPGGFPDSASGSPLPSPSYSPVKSDFRPSTAPSQPRARPAVKPKQDTASAPRQSRSLSRPKSRRERNASVGKQTASVSPLGRTNGADAEEKASSYRDVSAENSKGAVRGTDVDRLLDGIFAHGVDGPSGGVDGAASGPSARLSGNVRYNALGDVPSNGRRRRQSAGGIGRPPY